MGWWFPVTLVFFSQEGWSHQTRSAERTTRSFDPMAFCRTGFGTYPTIDYRGWTWNQIPSWFLVPQSILLLARFTLLVVTIFQTHETKLELEVLLTVLSVKWWSTNKHTHIHINTSIHVLYIYIYIIMHVWFLLCIPPFKLQHQFLSLGTPIYSS